MGTQAVHIEITHNLNSDSFIQALTQVIAHRGNIEVLYSDNHTNFVGCANKLKKAYSEMDNERIKSFMGNLGGDLVRWIRNPPAASDLVGIWERQIRSTRAILSSLLSTYAKSLDKESLLMLVAETEGILNSQPLTLETISDLASDLPFVLSNILTMKLKVVVPPPGDLSRPDLSCQKRWHCVQYIANEF